ncbi:MAG: alpha/beta hydrolase [Dehalococcoidia bacterium]
MYWIHGGGYIGGSYDGNNDLASAWVRDLNCVVASIDYRLAPECPYPGPLDDCYAGLAWLTKNAATLQVDPAHVLIAGGSAGAGLAAALALLVRDRAEIAITHQILIYPMIDDRRTTASSQWDTWVWTKNSNEIGWRSYLGPLFGKDDVPAYAAPSRATDLSNLPATFMMVGTLDLFLDEDLEYAQRLIHSRVPVELHVYPGAPHGFDVPRFGGKSQLAARARRELKEYLRIALTG